jgi:hypothetical protein
MGAAEKALLLPTISWFFLVIVYLGALGAAKHSDPPIQKIYLK